MVVGQANKFISTLIIQGRMSSNRLPGKTLMKINGIPLLGRIVNNLSANASVDHVVVATSTESSDDPIHEYCTQNNIKIFRGELKDVRKRFYEVAKSNKSDFIIRVTSDNVLTSSYYINLLLDHIKSNNELEYVRMKKNKIVDGTGSEVFSFNALEKSISTYADDYNKEHVTPAIIDTCRIEELVPDDEQYEINQYEFLGIDTSEDFAKVSSLYSAYGNEICENKILKDYIKACKELKI